MHEGYIAGFRTVLSEHPPALEKQLTHFLRVQVRSAPPGRRRRLWSSRRRFGWRCSFWLLLLVECLHVSRHQARLQRAQLVVHAALRARARGATCQYRTYKLVTNLNTGRLRARIRSIACNDKYFHGSMHADAVMTSPVQGGSNPTVQWTGCSVDVDAHASCGCAHRVLPRALPDPAVR